MEESNVLFLLLYCCYVRIAEPWDLRKSKLLEHCNREERNTHSSLENPVTPAELKVWVGVENLASVVPIQSNDSVVKHVERETFSQVLLKVRTEEIVSPSEEIPSVVKLEPGQFGEPALIILGAEAVIYNGYRKDNTCANGAKDKLIVLDDDGT